MMTDALILEIPDSDEDRATWLENQLVSKRLPEVVAQLIAFKQIAAKDATTTKTLDLDEFVRKRGDALYQDGLKAISADDLHRLLQDPESLFQLQTLVFAHGSTYWDRIIQADPVRASQVLATGMEKEAAASSISKTPSSSKVFWWASLAAAAVVMLVVGFQVLSGRSNDLSSELAAASILGSNASAPEYFTQIADAGQAWNEIVYSDQTELLDGLAKFSVGCQKLIDAPHRPLGAKQKQWLKDKCGNWKAKIDSVHDRLAIKEISFAQAREETKQVVEKLVTALREQSELS